jgi:hypothetical protein
MEGDEGEELNEEEKWLELVLSVSVGTQNSPMWKLSEVKSKSGLG